LEALLLAGFSMVIAGSSAPASGGEHLISHYLDMKHALWGTPNDLHGAQVGVATVHTLGLWERVLALDPQEINVDACVARQLEADEVRRLILEDWGEVAQEVMLQWQQKELTRERLRDEIQKFITELPRLRDSLKHELLPPKTVADAIRAAGGPAVPEDLASPVTEFQLACKNARYLRNRFTILDLSAELVVE
jgi:glycerol-1-phosphate dehydrogenase [NAD(P)+]